MLLLDELRSLGECQIVAQLDAIPPLDDITPEHCYTSWDIILSTDRGEDAIRDVFIFVEDDCELTIDIIDRRAVPDPERDYKKLTGEILVEKGVVAPGKVESAIAEQTQVRKCRAKEEGASSIRVTTEKLDKLVNLVGGTGDRPGTADRNSRNLGERRGSPRSRKKWKD